MDINIFFVWFGILALGAVIAVFAPKNLKSAVVGAAIASAIGICAAFFKTGVELPQGTLSYMMDIPLLLASKGGAESIGIFHSDGYGFFMALVVLAVSFLIAIYSGGYMSGEEHQGEFYSLFLVFVASMVGLIFSNHLIAFYIFWEITAFCSWRLIGLRRKPEHLAAANQAMLITSLGAVAMLSGIALIYKDTNTFSLASLKGYQPTVIVSLLILAGIFSKSAQIPLHLWLPDAGVAPTPVTALLHAAVLVKIGVYAYFRLFNATMVLDPRISYWVGVISVATALISSAAAARENDIKRILAYSTISQLSYIMFAFSLNTSTAVVAGFIYILAHSFAKAGLFLAAGVVEHNTHTKDITKLGGLKKMMPVTNAAFLLCALSIIGIPPLAGFFAKYSVISAAFDSHRFYSGALLIAAAMMTMYYLMRFYKKVFTGSAGEAVAALPDVREKSFSMVWVVMAFGLISLILGVLIKFPTEILSKLL